MRCFAANTQPTVHHATDTMQHAPCNMQHATDTDAACLDANCNPPQQHSSRSDRATVRCATVSGTAACLCNAVSTLGAFAEHAPINRPWYAHGSDVCFRLCTATGNSASKEVRIRFPFDAHGNDRELHSYRCHVWSRSHRLRVGCFAVLHARAEALADARGCRSNGRIRNPEIRR